MSATPGPSSLPQQPPLQSPGKTPADSPQLAPPPAPSTTTQPQSTTQLDSLTPTDLRNKLEAVRKDLRANLQKKRKIDSELASLESSIYAFEGSYLSDSLLPASTSANAASAAAAQFGNIIRGYDSYLKAPAGGGGDRKRGGRIEGGVNEKERMFSASSATYQRALDLRAAEMIPVPVAPSISGGMSESEEDVAAFGSRRKRSRF